MLDKTYFILYRDNLLRPTSRIFKQNNISYASINYFYNHHGDLSQVIYKEDNKTTTVYNYQYNYDKYENKVLKVIEGTHYSKDMPNSTSFENKNTKSTFSYLNEYDNDKIIKKSCFHKNTKLYETLYYYAENKISHVEKYNTDKLNLWQIEKYNYLEDKIEKAIYLANGILSHYIVVKLLNGEIVNKILKNPANGKYHWRITSFENDFCSIYVSEDYFSADILAEILSYIIDIKKDETEYTSVVIECSDTNVDTSDSKLLKTEQYFKKLGIYVQYSA